MESQPQNPEFRNNPDECSKYHFLIGWPFQTIKHLSIIHSLKKAFAIYMLSQFILYFLYTKYI